MSRQSIEITFLSLIILVAFFLKLWFASNNHFLFWFDQARDATVAQEMVQTKHLKVQGPSASGTQDTIYHGVLWYYFLAPAYTIFQGNPQGVIFVLAILTSLAIVPFYILAKDLTSSPKIALLASFLIAISPDSITNTTWLANPVLAYMLIPIFYLAIWRTFFQKKYWWLVLALFTLGLLQQAIIFLSYLWMAVILSYFYDWQQKRKNHLPWRIIIVALGAYLLSISTMLIAQVKLLIAGICPTLVGASTDLIDINTFTSISNVVNLYLEKVRWFLLPEFPVLSVLIVAIAFLLVWKKFDQSKKLFLAIWFLTPLFLLLFHYRNAPHIILGSEWVIALGLSVAGVQLANRSIYKYLQAICLVILVGGQIMSLRTMRQKEESFVGTQQGAWLDQQLAVIDKTYLLSNGAPFSLSTFTNPYGYNTTWAYLYHWYGKQKYGYLPSFYGPDQTGIFAGQLMTSSNKPAALHFTIIEPVVGVPEIITNSFMNEQAVKVGTPSAVYKFGSLILQQR